MSLRKPSKTDAAKRDSGGQPEGRGPLTPAVLHILLALSARDLHGYGVMKQVEVDSDGKAKMGPGTLYGSLGRMMKAGLVAESGKRADPQMDDERRVYYRITALGRKTLAAELERYRAVVAIAAQGLSPGRGVHPARTPAWLARRWLAIARRVTGHAA
jgi:DNA-binding PadR family transcriptional regulator